VTPPTPVASTPTSRLRTRVGEIDLYIPLAVLLVVLLVAQTLNRRWSTDYWLHQATLDAFRNDLWHPVHPLIGTHDKFEYYSPYTFVLAVIARVSGASSVVVLQCAAVANLVLFLVGFRLFVRELTNRAAVTWALVATLLFWGLRPWRWSGFLDLNSIGFGLPYPSMFATALAFIVGWAVLRYGATTNRWWLVFVGVGLPTVMLTHPFTGVWTTVMLVALTVHRRLLRRDLIAPLALTLVVVVAVLAIWPYYPFFRLFVGDNPHTEGSVLYNAVPLRLFAAIPGVVVLWRRFKRDRTDELALMFIGAAALYAVGGFTADHNFARVIPLLVLPLHIGEGELIASALEPRERPARPMLAWLALCGIVGLVGVSPAFPGFVPRRLLPGSLADKSALQPLTSRYTELRHALPAGSEVVVQITVMQEVAPAYGLRVLSTSASAFVPDAGERRQASNAILSVKTDPARRARLIRQYHVAGVLCATRSCRQLFDGAEVAVDDWTLVRLDAGT
jgi:hypothetical protein